MSCAQVEAAHRDAEAAVTERDETLHTEIDRMRMQVKNSDGQMAGLKTALARNEVCVRMTLMHEC